jgi:hypothetical protein
MTGLDHSTRPRFDPSIESPFGPSNRAVAKAPFPTEATVKSHLARIYRKRGTGSRAVTIAEP